jgi:hypothetical protein
MLRDLCYWGLYCGQNVLSRVRLIREVLDTMNAILAVFTRSDNIV